MLASMINTSDCKSFIIDASICDLKAGDEKISQPGFFIFNF
jgi:hypothetical protein